jgi:hypothetical protein
VIVVVGIVVGRIFRIGNIHRRDRDVVVHGVARETVPNPRGIVSCERRTNKTGCTPKRVRLLLLISLLSFATMIRRIATTAGSVVAVPFVVVAQDFAIILLPRQSLLDCSSYAPPTITTLSLSLLEPAMTNHVNNVNSSFTLPSNSIASGDVVDVGRFH